MEVIAKPMTQAEILGMQANLLVSMEQRVNAIDEKGSIGGWDINASAIYSKTGNTYSTMKIGGSVALAFGSPGITSTTGATTQFWHNGHFNIGDGSLTYYGGNIKMTGGRTEVTFGTVSTGNYTSARGLRMSDTTHGSFCDITANSNGLNIVSHGTDIIRAVNGTTYINAQSPGVRFQKNNVNYGVRGDATIGSVTLRFEHGLYVGRS